MVKTYGIIGFPQFLDGHYIYFVTKKEKVCDYFGSSIYRVEEAKLEILLNENESCLYNFSSLKSSEIKYLDYFNSMNY